MAQNKALAQQINLLNSKLGTMQLAAANTQIGPCDLRGIQGHSSETCTAILEQQSSEQAEFGAEVAGESERNEKIATKPRRPLLEPMRTHLMEPCVRI
ncbi:hypothetical protein PIB30_060913 [Stylosanthes scabra]|uniref:Uncharacterized protein n=1 Tax=Stylosanthes scabra TaxID=79078 RepID=A0ABU6ZJC7_9FABA|nr:hypothetical protein [Stylosanthes scabra]